MSTPTTPDELTPLLDQLASAAALPPERAEALPPGAYTSPAFYERELARVFREDWLCVARADELPGPGDYLRLDLFGTPIVLTRDEDGVIHALSRVCRHRFMDLLPPETTAERGSVDRLTCPYHAWSYRLDGRYAGHLAAAPLMRRVGFGPADRAACRLPTLRVELWCGFVLVNLAADAPPAAPQLTGLTEQLAAQDLSSWRAAGSLRWEGVAANWKVAVENGLENYHHLGTHAASLEPVLPARRTVLSGAGEKWVTTFLPFAGAARTGGESPGDAGMFLVGLFPHCVLTVLPGFALWFRWLPTGPAQHDTQITVLLPPARAGSADSGEHLDYAGRVGQVQEEDLVAIRGVQRGLNAGPPPSAGRLSQPERPLWQFQRYLADRLR